MNITPGFPFKKFFLSSFIAFALFGFAPVTEYKQLHFDAIVVDTHNDVVQRILNGEDISVRTKHGHSDLPRFKEGGVDIQMFSIWVPPEKTKQSYYEQANEQIDSIMSFVRRNPKTVVFAKNIQEARKGVSDGKFVAMMGMEGAHPFGNNVKRLEHFYKRGIRYVTLTWNNSTGWATSAKDETDKEKRLTHKGLTPLGVSMIKKMNELGMMIDISHVGEQTFWDVMKVTKKPVIASHSSAWELCRHRRNLNDKQLRAIAEKGGVVFINFNPGFIDSSFQAKENALLARNKNRIDSLKKVFSGDEFLQGIRISEMLADEYRKIRPTLKTLIDHFDYVAKRIGVEHVGIGSDFDGISVVPLDMDDVTYLPNITRELLKRGYSENDVKKMLGGNFLRVLGEVERK